MKHYDNIQTTITGFRIVGAIVVILAVIAGIANATSRAGNILSGLGIVAAGLFAAMLILAIAAILELLIDIAIHSQHISRRINQANDTNEDNPRVRSLLRAQRD